MMSWKPPQVAFEPRHLVKALFDSTTAEAELMSVAARGDVEITASRSCEGERMEEGCCISCDCFNAVWKRG